MSESLAVSIGFGRGTTRKLTHVGLTLAPVRRRSRWLIVPALVAAALTAGVAIGHVLRDAPAPVVVQRPVSPPAELAALRQQLEEARMALRVADARSQELERQIDAFNQKLTESQDQLTFFKKAREGKH